MSEENKATYRFEITGIDCANCAAKLESKIAEIEGISNVSLSFMNNSLTYDCNHDDGKKIEEAVCAVAAKEEPDAVITAKGHSHHHHHDEEHHHEHGEHCECHHEHHHDHEEAETATYRFEITGIDCANCAAKLESKIAEIEGISNVSLSFMNNSLTYDCNHDDGKKIEEAVRAVAAKEEPDAVITAKGHSHHHHHDEEHHHEHGEHCECHHEHHHDHEEAETATYRFEITGIDCANCAAKLESKIAEIEGISNVSLSFMNNSLTYDCNHDDGKKIEEAVRALAEKEEPDAVITAKGHSHHHHHHDEEHHHDHEVSEERSVHETELTRKYRITGLDCADCAAKLEGKLAEAEGVSAVNISFMTSTLRFDCKDEDLAKAEEQIRAITAKEEPEAVIEKFPEKTSTETVKKEEPKTDPMLIRLIVGAVLFVCGLFLSGNLQTAVMLIAYLILGYDVLYKAVKGIGRGQVFDEHFLMAVATCSAIYLQDFKEAAGVMLFYQIGEYFQELAVRKSRKSIGELMDIRPEFAVVYRHGEWVTVDPEEVDIGERILVKPGERVPLDGVIVKGASSLDTSGLTGESRPADVDEGDNVCSGSVNGSGVLEIKVTSLYQDSTVARVLDLVENQESRKANAEQFISKFSRYYTPIVVFSAIAVAIIVALFGPGLREGIERACTFLVISCPCALVISIPLSFFAGIGGLSSRGILVKGANLIETLAGIDQVVMDKTGTLTSGEFAVEEIIADADLKDKVLEDAAKAEMLSNHPVAAGIRRSYGKAVDNSNLHDASELPGRGMSVTDGEEVILAGNYKLMKENNIACSECSETGTLVYVARNGKYEGCLVLRDQLKEEAKPTVDQLHQIGKKCMIVSGDHKEITEMAGRSIGADAAFGECLPHDKVEKINELKKSGTTAFVGDGVNDAPVLVSADIGIAMGAMGSDAAIEAADVVIMDDKIEKIPLAIGSAKRILKVVNENIYGAIAIKVGTLILGAFGIANMWMAIFADTGVAMLCVLNSMRLLKISEKN